MLYDQDEMVDSLPSKSFLTSLKSDAIELISNYDAPSAAEEFAELTLNDHHQGTTTGVMRSGLEVEYNNSYQDTTRTETATLDKLAQHPKGFQFLLDKLKESIQEAKDLSSYFKKIAALEIDYGTNLSKFDGIYKDLDQRVAELRLNFGKEVGDLSETIAVLVKDTERSRKQLKEAMTKYSRQLQDTDEKMGKAREKYESSLQEWEKFRDGGNTLSKFGMFKQKLAMDLKILPRNEDEAKIKVSHLNTVYNQLLQSSNSLHETYTKIHLPRVCGALMDAFDNSQHVTQRVLERFGELREKVVMGEAMVVSPLEGVGVKGFSKVKEVDWSLLDDDTVSITSKPRVSIATPRTSLSLNGFGKSSIVFPSATMTQFGKSLEEIADLTTEQVPTLVQNCIDYIQSTGLYQEGIYRVSGNSNQITMLKQSLDQNPGLPLEDVVKDIHSVTGVLKLFFREMKEPLIPRELFSGFVQAAKMENERVGLVKIHELINSLDDLNYGTLKILAKHLSIVSQNHVKNKMTAGNLGIAWGPNVMDSGKIDANDLHYSARVVEVVIDNVDNLFEFD